jgi:Spy/CpxP family protein refolding chaperone
MVLAAGFAAAQAGRSGDEDGSLGRVVSKGPTGPQVRTLTRREMLVDRLKLSKEQKDEADKIFAAATDKTAGVRDELTKGRIAIANAITGNASEAEVNTLLADYTKTSAKLTGIEAEAFSKLYALLKPNQQTKSPHAFELMAGMFFGGPGGGGPGGGPNGGGGRR